MAANNQVIENIIIEKNSVTRTLGVLGKGWKERAELRVRINFEGCGQDQILEWASRALAVSLQARLRTMDESFVKNLAKKGVWVRNASTITVVEDPDAKAKELAKAVNEMTPEQAEQILAALQAKIGGKK